jgi:hypothetical protein
MAEFAPATTTVVVHGGMSVPVDEYKKVEGQSPELSIALARLFDTSQAFAGSYIKDPSVRADYSKKIRAAANEIMERVRRRELTPHEGAQTANAMRNEVLRLMRSRSTVLGRSIAEEIKPEGKSLDFLQEKYAKELYSKSFDVATEAERNDIWATIVDRAGKSSHAINVSVRYFGIAGRVLLIASLAWTIYDVSQSNNKERTAAKDFAGIEAGLAAGALVTAGLGAVAAASPIVVIGTVFVAGVLASEAIDQLFDYYWPER